ncbi:MAG: endonuclease III [Desulfobacteraceae bacterium]|nr:MAG: endonuclease III [Desulfobacteraceae bacterium]
MPKPSRVAKDNGRRQRVLAVAQELERLFPDAKIALNYSNHWELLVAVVLSAQCTDKKVNEVTARLFKKYPTLADYLAADRTEFEEDIRQTGFFRNKAKNVLASAEMVRSKFDGRVPQKMEDLLSLPGVARKTANIVQGNAFGIVEGIAVDTHVRRLSLKLGLTEYDDPNKIEKELMQLLPREQWFKFTYRMIDYGRNICPARKHGCQDHPLTRLYPDAAQRWP